MRILKKSLESNSNDFVLYEKPFEKIDDILDPNYKFVKNNKKIEYLNIPAAFDIETTSMEDEDGNKIAFMYAYTLNLNGKHVLGRTWDEFMFQLEKIKEFYSLNDKRRIIIYIHNLSFEFQFLRSRFKWEKVFALKEREVCYALTSDGIEFRCSYILSGYKLETLAKNLHTYKVEKLVGDLDYSKIRHSSTFLSEEEKQYIYNDGLIVVAFIKECITEEHNNISNIPLTKTGYVRRYCRRKCLYADGYKNSHNYLDYRKKIKALTITSKEEYFQLKRAYIGAHTHGNPLAIGQILNDVYSVDLTSSYPYTMVSYDGFPMSKGKRVKITSKEMFYEYIDLYACIFDVTFINIRSKVSFDHVIPSSKCYEKINASLDNGKLIKADMVSMTLTEVDFKSFSMFYEWDEMKIKNFRRYYKGYLPKAFILSILHLYKDKTELKGIKGKEAEYMHSKTKLNAGYGMMVTDICRPDIIYTEDNEWDEEEPDYDKVITKYNKSRNRFLFYIWGLYVTSVSKARLLDGEYELKYDWLYSDTDSLKFLHYEKHKKYFIKNNNEVRKNLLKMCKHYKINPALIEPLNKNGEKCLLGIWDAEFEDDNPSYKKFKYLGSKRYAYQLPDNTYSFTVSGCNKNTAIPYLATGLCSNIKSHELNFELLDKFDDKMYIPPEYTGKNCHTYFDYEVDGEITDYLGKNGKYHEFSGVNISPVDFTLSLTSQFIDYILGLRGVL